MLLRVDEVAEGEKKGRKKISNVQMKIFDDCFHDALHAQVPASNVKLFDEQLSYTMPQVQTAALEQQEEILRRIRQQSEEGEAAQDMQDALGDDFLSAAVLHNQSLLLRVLDIVHRSTTLRPR